MTEADGLWRRSDSNDVELEQRRRATALADDHAGTSRGRRPPGV
jgi:hypothetical protein